MKLSIIIPVHNEEQYLKRCLDSVVRSIKAHNEVEVLVIDDGSEDGSWDIAQTYENFKLIKRTQTSFGVSFARNIGINEATGDYVTFLDSDDEYYENAVSSMLQEIRDHEGEDIIQFEHSRASFRNGSGYRKLTDLPHKWVLCWNKVYRRDFLWDNHITFPYGLQFEEDRIFNLRAFNHCQCFYHSGFATVIKHFENKDSLCHTVDGWKIFDLTNELMAFLKYDDVCPEVKAIARKCLADLYQSKNALRLWG